MSGLAFDLDSLASGLRDQMATRSLSVRAAAREIGCSAATLSRLRQGSSSAHHPAGLTFVLAASWLGRSLYEFSPPGSSGRPVSTIADVELHLRAIPDLPSAAAEGLVAMVRNAYETARRPRGGVSDFRTMPIEKVREYLSDAGIDTGNSFKAIRAAIDQARAEASP